ncbi:hypothetical protein OPQ81_001879 [Rhizoctonia solani]|nr:hypothetical protein OPQ81_001879 [Rhizoctonia solani]
MIIEGSGVPGSWEENLFRYLINRIIKFGYASPVISMLLEYACKTEGRNLSLVPRYTRFTSGFCKQLCRLDPPKRCRLKNQNDSMINGTNEQVAI